ncbi:hypothetical protein B0F90DRAFT_1708994 [Multifurca ochricompacta]|uniref:Uncharacterized protein n=1 Tax=Multifurca ochricompacta TaxID=376703 RepID=A0AAD4M6L8_9AGAM|nr:hypothetical protein B0F90DRAFT_1708994 [Multifurca ochricompacta]
MTVTSDTRKPYSGTTRSLALAFDVGTTFSGVSYAILEPNEIPKIHGVTRYPGQEHVAGSYKIPTIMYYDQEGDMKVAGAEADSNAIIDLAEDEGWIKAELFKLRLRPQTMKLKMNGMRLPPLPKGKTAVQVFGDYLGYLFKCTKSFIIDTHAGGSSLWRAVEEDLQFVLSHPNGWEGAQQTKMRRAAVYGGLVPDTDAGKARIRFVTEGEASLHACVLNGLAKEMLTGYSGNGFLVADAGGGTLDISSYAVRGTVPLVMEEIAPPDCVFAGSVFVSRRARAFFEDKLRGSKYGTPDSLEHITKRFDETTKRLFRDKKEPQYVQFGSPLDKDPSAGIRQGQLKLTGTEVAELFEPSIEAAMTSIAHQVETTGGFVKSVWLVGGFAASPWLFSQLQERLAPLGVTVSRPDNQTSKAVADGAIGFYCDHHVSARMSKFMYGVEFLREYNPEDPDHVARQDRMCELPSGPKLLADAFDCILARGVKVKESSVFTRKYCTEVTSLSTLSVFEVEIWCYRGGASVPMWIDRHAEDFTTLCIVQADLSPLAGSAQSKPERTEKHTFGLTEFRARIKWVDSVSGQRAEEDDLDDDDPAPSAYISRAPSPPPVIESHLPVPEKSYLEVPNPATSVRSGKSRDSPPEVEGVDKGKRRESAASGAAHSRSMSMSRNIPSGIELPGPIALTDSNSSRRSGSGRLGETLTANSSVLPSPLEGPTSRSVLLNALKPLASVPEGSAVPEVIHADASMEAVSVPDVHRSEPPKTPKAETPRASASPSRVPVAASAVATSPKLSGTPKASSKIPTVAASPYQGGTPRGVSIYSNGSQPPALRTPKGSALGPTSPTHVSPPTDAVPPEPPTIISEPEATQIDPPAIATPKRVSRTPTKPPTRAASPQPLRASHPPDRLHAPRHPCPRLYPRWNWINLLLLPAIEEAPAAPTAAEEEDAFSWGQLKAKATSRKASRATSKGVSKAASKVATPKGSQTPKPVESTSASGETPAVDGTKPPSRAPSPLPSVPEDPPAEVPAPEAPPVPEVALPEQSHTPGGFFVVNPDEVPADPPPPAQTEATSFPSLGSALSGGKEDKSKPSTPIIPAPAWGGFGSHAPSVAESTGGAGWGAATGNNSRSNSAWLDFEEGNKSSTADLLDGAVNASSTMAPALAESGDPELPTPADGILPADLHEEAMPQIDLHAREHLTVKTDVAAAADAVTGGPITAGDSPEGEGGEGGGGEGGEDASEKPVDDDWGGIQVKSKKKKNGGGASTSVGTTPVTPNAAGGGDEWATTPVGNSKKKKLGKRNKIGKLGNWELE